ncbi:ornithine cyclodeaminase family protein [Thalassococcus sp. S3]|uniref:ornithine cyclodeaminase family protein n=1 Tax=Thalassococcus sp. S3 TaxID=2017482 RepID=UPI0010248C56|nr:NAD(P)-binding domain-containing protein [Thalassococcus sp. S3]QBF29862.1 ornithine cyclodeaminase [Thalassococcus sp. S3]
MSIPFISFAEGEAVLDWHGLCDALAEGHQRPKAEIGDTFLYRDPDTLLSRAAWIDGLGMAVKTATIFPENPGRGAPMINGAVCLYSDRDGTLEALLDFHLVTKWKTAGDSLLAAKRLAPSDAGRVLIVGAGTVGASLIEAFRAGFPEADIAIWNRTEEKARILAEAAGDAEVESDLSKAVEAADIIVSATMSSAPVIRGEWLRAGQHVNLIGAYRPDMREVDDRALNRSRIYVDSFDTTVEHIGEIAIPLKTGAIRREDLLADYYDLSAFTPGGPDEITLFKNGGGAHLDLMTSRHILEKWQMAR